MNIIADQQIPHAAEAFKQFGTVHLYHGRDINRTLVKNADILLVRSITKINAELLDDTAVKLVGSATSGIDHIDLDYLATRNIPFVYAPGSNARSVAEYVLSSLMALYQAELQQLQDATVGIVGYGHVGSTLARILQALNIRCIVNDPPLADRDEEDFFVSLEQVLENSDIVTLHVPLTEEGKYPTYHLIGMQQLAMLKTGSVIINTSRGGIVDESALLEYLQQNQLKAVIDVWQNEPDISMDLLQVADIATPHIAGYSQDGKLRATEMLYHAACEVFTQQADWSASDEGVDEKPRLQMINPGLSDMEILSELVLSAYDIKRDHADLINMQSQSDKLRGQFFDRLRKDYRNRLEFFHTAYNKTYIKQTLADKLAKIGFTTMEFT